MKYKRHNYNLIFIFSIFITAILASAVFLPSGNAIAFVHSDPNHIHSEILKDTSTGNVVWHTIPIKHPGGSDTRILTPASYLLQIKNILHL